MRGTTGITLLMLGVALGFFLGPQRLRAAACTDDESMVADYKKSMADLVATVKKESLTDFERAFHQKSSLTKLTLSLSMLDGLLNCLDKAAQDTTATKDDVEAYKAKRETYGKLREKIQHERTALKATEDPKDAKALIAKFDLGD